MNSLITSGEYINHHISCGFFCITKGPGELSTEFYKAYIAYTKMTNWASILNNDDCVKSSANTLYWEAVEKTKTDELSILLYLLIGIGAVVTIAGIILGLLCYRKKDGMYVKGTRGINESY